MKNFHTPVLFGLLFFFLISQAYKVFAGPPLPVPDHIVIAILENHGYDQIINSSSAPKINALANDSATAWFTIAFGIEHPSQPNYLDLFSGCNQGVTDDNVPSHFFTSENLAHELISAGKTFITYSEDLPSVGYNGASNGKYQRKHNPVTNWVGKGTNQVDSTTNQPFTAFPTDFTTLPTVSYVVPNQDHDMHDGTIQQGDTWIYNNLNGYIQWAKTHNSLFILTFDEDNGLSFNHIVTLFTGQMVKKGQYNESINHYSVLRTIETMYGIGYACHDSVAHLISDCWNTLTGIKEFKQGENNFSVFPNPSQGDITISIKSAAPGKLQKFEVYNMCGGLVHTETEETTGGTFSKEIRLNDLAPGIYFVKGTIGDYTSYEKIVIQ